MVTSVQTRPEPMNSSPHHPKVKVSMTLAHPIYVAGKYVTGKMEVECRADHGLGVGVIMVELFAVQELTSRDHSAKSPFLHSRRLFQGPNLPPSNAVQAYPMPGDPLYPPHYHQARRGISTFLFRIPLPSTSPSSISFGSDIARVRYELRATTGVFWKGQKTLVVCKREIDVVESYDVNFYRSVPEGVVIGEYGKIWVQGKVVGDMVIAGESGCLELQVKNHSNKKNTGLTLTLTRNLELPGLKPGETSPLKISDVLTTVPFRGAEYIIEPGVEGVASLVFDVPVHARGVRNGPYEGDEAENRLTDAIFEVQCIIGVTINMGFGAKDIHLDIPVPIVHPAALPEPIELITYPTHPPQPSPFPQILHDPYVHAGPPLSVPILAPYLDPVQNQVWLPPLPTHTNDAPYYAIPAESVEQEYYVPPPPDTNVPTHTPLRPMSTGPMGQQPLLLHAMGLGAGPASPPTSQHFLAPFGNVDPEEGKGERAMRITQHLRHSSRHRSVSPRSHRFPLPVPPVGTAELLPTPPVLLPSVPVRTADPILHSPRPFLSPKRSFTNSLPKSERVEDLERMAEEVEKVSADLSGDLPKAPFESQDPESGSSPPIDVTEVQESTVDIPDINKTLPNPPPSIRELNDNLKANGRTRIDELFGDPSSVPPETPRTPMVAVTPVKLPFKPRSAEFRAQLSPNGHAESGLDALEKRLLAEVGTRKMDLANERRPVWSIVGAKPIDIPTKDMVPEEPMNDSAISSLTLAGGCMGNDREEVDVDAGHDSSDEKTHRAKKSTASVGSKKGSKDKEERGKRKSKKVKDKSHGKDGEGNQARKKKTAAVKGKVSAWLGEIDPDAPPLEDLLPPSPSVAKFAQGLDGITSTDDDNVIPMTDTAEADEPLGIADSSSAAPDPRSSGFVPIGSFKPGTLQAPLKNLSKDATVVLEANRVTEMWLSSSAAFNSNTRAPTILPQTDNQLRSAAVLKELSPAFPSIHPSRPAVQSILTDRNVSPPSAAGIVDLLGAKPFNIKTPKLLPTNFKESNLTKTKAPSPNLTPVVAPQFDPEVKYDVRSARGGRGGKVTAITSLWPAGGATPDPWAVSNPLRSRVPNPVVTTGTQGKLSLAASSPTTLKAPPQTPMKSLLTATAPIGISKTDHKPVDLGARPPRALIKSPSVPAIISSSHATPTLSSTASLARPATTRPHLPAAKPAPALEARLEPSKRVTSPSHKPGSTGEMAFGKARLRDLIKKYQGQTA